MPHSHHAHHPDGLVIRTYQPGDQQVVQHLYTHGLLAGQIDPNDTGADIDNMQDAYFTDPRHHFWVAQQNDQVIGMIGVGNDTQHTAEIRRLRIDPTHQHAKVADLLIETALEHCRRHGYLKVVFDTRFERHAALDLFTRLGFQHTRSKTHHGREALEFYLDLYRPTKSHGD